jgi:ElaA protein
VGAYLRVLLEPGGERRIGRVVTAPAARGHGLAGVLMAAAVADHGGGGDGGGGGSVLVLDAQAHLQGWYARFGFAASGPQFLEDAIPHVPMRREPAGPTAR